jgi:hypothetical protein
MSNPTGKNQYSGGRGAGNRKAQAGRAGLANKVGGGRGAAIGGGRLARGRVKAMKARAGGAHQSTSTIGGRAGSANIQMRKAPKRGTITSVAPKTAARAPHVHAAVGAYSTSGRSHRKDLSRTLSSSSNKYGIRLAP